MQEIQHLGTLPATSGTYIAYTVWDPYTVKAVLQLEMVYRAARWVKNNYMIVRPAEFSHRYSETSSGWPDPEANRCKTLTDIQNTQPCPDRSNKICYSTKEPHQPTTDPGKQEVQL